MAHLQNEGRITMLSGTGENHLDDNTSTLENLVRGIREETTAIGPLQFKDISVVTVYENLQNGIDRDFPALRNANQNHVYPFSMLPTLIREKMIDSEQMRIVQSVDRQLWIASEGIPCHTIPTHSAMARIPDPTQPNHYIMNNYALYAGSFSWRIDNSEEASKIHLYEFTNRSGGFKAKFNDMQIMLISLLNELAKLPSVTFSPEVMFSMEEFCLIAAENRTTSRFASSRENLISMLTELNTKYQKTIFTPQKLATYASVIQPTTMTEVESYEEYERLLNETGGTSTRNHLTPFLNTSSSNSNLSPKSSPVQPPVETDEKKDDTYKIARGVTNENSYFFRPPPTPDVRGTKRKSIITKRRFADTLNIINEHVAEQVQLIEESNERINNLLIPSTETETLDNFNSATTLTETNNAPKKLIF